MADGEHSTSQLEAHSTRRKPSIPDASHDDDARPGVHDTIEDLGYLNIADSPAPSIDSQLGQTSSSTVAPVDIISRKPLVSTPNHFGGLSNRGTRTPSPNGLPSSLNDHLTGNEGPMTPRNDVGPFIFDGSAGRETNLDISDGAPSNINEVTSPSQRAS